MPLSATDRPSLVGEHDHGGPSDFDLDPELRALQRTDVRPLRAAAVLVPLVAASDRSGIDVLLTKRTQHVATHKGQIAFPGGKVEPADPDPLTAALRETEEEVGIDRRFVEPLGYLDTYMTRTGFLVTPVVGLLHAGFEIRPDPREVDIVFHVPFSYLMDAANHRIDSAEFNGRSRRFYAIPYGEHYIWGATAGMLKNLHERLCRP
ncbi:MAG: CoA pyrophosphatase [Hyphomicrobiaceae bacterium]